MTKQIYSEETEFGTFVFTRDDDEGEVVRYSHKNFTAKISPTATEVDLSGIRAVLDLIEPECNFAVVALNGENDTAIGLVYYSMVLDEDFVETSSKYYETTCCDTIWLWSAGGGTWTEVIYVSDKPD